MTINDLDRGPQASQAYDEGSIPFTRSSLSNFTSVNSIGCASVMRIGSDAAPGDAGTFAQLRDENDTRFPKKVPKGVHDSSLAPVMHRDIAIHSTDCGTRMWACDHHEAADMAATLDEALLGPEVTP